MRSVLIIILVCFQIKNIYCQNYIPFPEDSAQWSIWHTFNSGNSVESIQYKMKGDTVINGLTYSKVYKSYILFYGANDTDLHCFIRQDTALKQVYIKYPYSLYQDSSEFILYDFNMQTGDTINFKIVVDGSIHHLKVDGTSIGNTGYGPTPFFALLPIDSCLGVQGCLWGTACDNIGILEGIGEGNNFLYTEMPIQHCYPWGDNAYNLQCFWYKGQYILGGTFCDYSTGILDQKVNKLKWVQPNPVNNISILPNKGGIKEVLIFDVTGKFLRSLKENSNEPFEINANDYSNGYYFLKAVSGGGKFLMTSFIVAK